MNLKEKKVIRIGKYELLSNSYMYKMEDVKKAVLEFKTELEIEIKCLNQTPNSCLDIDNMRELLEKYKEVFGDFEK